MKEKIVERLLEEKHITAEEAVVLLAGSKEYVYISQPYYPGYWYVTPYPLAPYTTTIGTTYTVTTATTSK